MYVKSVNFFSNDRHLDMKLLCCLLHYWSCVRTCRVTTPELSAEVYKPDVDFPSVAPMKQHILLNDGCTVVTRRSSVISVSEQELLQFHLCCAHMTVRKWFCYIHTDTGCHFQIASCLGTSFRDFYISVLRVLAIETYTEQSVETSAHPGLVFQL
jgi:hypothetical protein